MTTLTTAYHTFVLDKPFLGVFATALFANTILSDCNIGLY